MKNGKYVVVCSKGAVRVEAQTRPNVNSRDMLVRVLRAGVCGTDVHLVNSPKPFPWKDPTYPFRLGHEFVGVVEEVGSEFPTVDAYGATLTVGDRVVVYPSTWACGKCFACRILLQPNLCLRPAFGRALPPDMAAFATWFYVPEGSTVFRIPDQLDTETATLTEPMAVALRAFERAMAPGIPDRYQGLGPGKSVVVLGTGTIGAIIVALARAANCAPVIAIGGPDHRLSICSRLGADLTVDVAETDEDQRTALVREQTLHGLGADVVFEAAGSPRAFVQAIEMCRPGATVVELGHYTDHGTAELNPLEICRRDLQIFGCWGYGPQHFGEAVRVLQRQPETFSQLITHRFGLQDAGDAIRTAATQKCMKSILEVSDDAEQLN